MIVNIYANYGVLAHEKRPLYHHGNEVIGAVCSDQVTVEIPDVYKPYITECGSLAVVLGKTTYLLNEVLSSTGSGKPCMRWVDDRGWHCVILRVIEK